VVGDVVRILLDGLADESSLGRWRGGSSFDRGCSSLCFRFRGSTDKDCRCRSEVSDEGVIEASADWARDAAAAAFLLLMERTLWCCSFALPSAVPFCFLSTPLLRFSRRSSDSPLMLERRLVGLLRAGSDLVVSAGLSTPTSLPFSSLTLWFLTAAAPSEPDKISVSASESSWPLAPGLRGEPFPLVVAGTVASATVPGDGDPDWRAVLEARSEGAGLRTGWCWSRDDGETVEADLVDGKAVEVSSLPLFIIRVVLEMEIPTASCTAGPVSNAAAARAKRRQRRGREAGAGVDVDGDWQWRRALGMRGKR